jgi:hypothetical protein
MNDRNCGRAAGTVSMVQELAAGPLFRFADWPDDRVPRRAAGVYTVWRADEFLYAGMSGRGAQREDFVVDSGQRSPARGLWTRLNSHASGRRSGDQDPPHCPSTFLRTHHGPHLGARDDIPISPLIAAEERIHFQRRQCINRRRSSRIVVVDAVLVAGFLDLLEVLLPDRRPPGGVVIVHVPAGAFCTRLVLAWRMCRPGFRFLSDIASQGRAISTSMPAIRRVWVYRTGNTTNSGVVTRGRSPGADRPVACWLIREVSSRSYRCQVMLDGFPGSGLVPA